MRDRRPPPGNLEVEIGVLGPLVLVQGTTAVGLRSDRQRILLAILVTRLGGVVTADELLDALWPQTLPSNPLAALQSQVFRLRRDLGAAAPSIETAGSGYRLSIDPQRVDAVRFEMFVGEARDANDPHAALRWLDSALGLWRGRAYLEVAEHEAVRGDAMRLEGCRAEANETRATLLLTLDRADEAGRAMELLAGEHPYRERPVALAMQALARQGRHAEALDVFARYRRRLGEDLGLEPSPALRAFEGNVLRHQMPMAPPAPAVGLPGNSFVGRDADLEDVAERLRHTRLVTLTGPGGVGKTRLALHVANRVAEGYPDGVYVCELARLADPQGVAAAVASTLRIGERAESTVTDRLLEFLRGRRVLLVVDNCEHVLAGATDLISAVLMHAPHVSVLATSRQRLGVEGEQRYPVEPLPIPARDDLAGPASALFVDRASAIRPGFVLDTANLVTIGRLCRHLEGLPLAIELAAARVVSRGPVEILAEVGGRLSRLADRRRTVDRHRSMEAVVGWSYGLLEPSERALFEQLAVFSGGFTAEAVAGVTGADSESVLDGLTVLAEHSLVGTRETAGRTRFFMLEPVRQFAEARLDEHGLLEQARARHAGWFVRWAEAADVSVAGVDELTWLARLDEELANLRAAHRGCVTGGGDPDGAIRLAAALHNWGALVVGAPHEVFTWVDETVARFAETGHPQLPRAFAVAAMGSWFRGDLGRARTLAEESIAVASLHQPADARWGWRVLWLTDVLAGDPARAVLDADQVIGLSRLAGDTHLLAFAHAYRALALGYIGEIDQACCELESVRPGLARHNGPSCLAYHDYVAGEIRLEVSPDEAQPFLLRSLDGSRRAGNHFLLGVARLSALSCATRLGQPVALGTFTELFDHWQHIGSWPQQWIAMRALIEMLTRLGHDKAGAVLLGALNGSEKAPPIFGGDAVRLADTAAILRKRLGGQRLARLQAEGAALSDEEAIAFALAAIRACADARREPDASRRISP
jgi:predicted ATPase/DNA-binding SARP family transcriptional activator